MIRSSSSFANTIAGRSASRRSRKRSGPKSRIALQDERSTLTFGASSAARSAAVVDRGAEQRVAGQVQVRAAVEPGGIELLGAQVGRDAAVGGHRARAVDADERDDGSGPARDDRAADVDAVAGEPRCGRPAGLVVGPLADESRLAAQLADPGGDVRGLAARARAG